MMSSLGRLVRTNPGFQPEHVLTVQVPTSDEKFGDPVRQKQVYAELLHRIETVPGVRATGFVNVLPLSGAEITTQVFAEGHAERSPIEVRMYVVSPSYFHAMGIPLRDGRLFNDFDGRDAAPWLYIVNEAFVRRYWPGESAIGKRIRGAGRREDNPWHQVIGVVADTRHGALGEVPSPAIYFHYQRYIGPTAVATVVIRASGDPGQLTHAVRRAIASVEAELPVSKVAPMIQVIQESIWQTTFSTTLLSLFAALSVVLATIGIYGTLSYAVNQSLPDIGIRLTLGATPACILRATLIDAMTPAIAGAAFGVLGALALTRLITAYLYEITATDPWTFAASIALLLAAALAASLAPARSAASTDPMALLRHE